LWRDSQIQNQRQRLPGSMNLNRPLQIQNLDARLRDGDLNFAAGYFDYEIQS
jgi:hypothetical protein